MVQRQAVLFQQALEVATALTRRYAARLGREVTLVRDLRGRIRPLLSGSPESIEQEVLSAYQTELSHSLGAYGFTGSRSVLFAEELAELPEVFRERRCINGTDEPAIYLLDRQIIGQDWMRETMARHTSNPRVTFYGIKGGVGRSTALVNWAWHLATQGKRVLVLDLDLESPGVSSSLLPPESLPDFGIVDWFVEDGVGQGEAVERELLGLSPLSQGQPGEVLVVPAYGRKTGDYMAKLARCYAEFSGDVPLSWAERLHKLVEHMEQTTTPDVVIFDSRAGLHDIAAVLATRMDADTLLFAINTPQTWTGYALLFKHWQGHPQVQRFRERLQIVASMVPETGRDVYLQSFKEHAWELFRESLYDQTGAEDIDAFSFDLDDDSAPHAPLPVFWHRALQEFDPNVGGIDSKTASEALGLFMEQADRLLETSGVVGRA